MTRTNFVKIDFVSDVACPWCAVGLNSLEIALARLEGVVSALLRFQPFELNPAMPPEGEDAVEYLSRKYGVSQEQLAALATLTTFANARPAIGSWASGQYLRSSLTIRI